MKSLFIVLVTAVAAALLGMLTYRQGEQAGRAEGCETGIRIESARAHEGWCRRLEQHGIQDGTLGTDCQSREATLETESLARCIAARR